MRPYYFRSHFYASTGGIICFRVVCPSVRPEPEIPSLHLYMGPFVHPTNRDRFAECPSVRRGFRAFAGECMEGMAWNFACWFSLGIYRTDSYGHGLLILPPFSPFCLGLQNVMTSNEEHESKKIYYRDVAGPSIASNITKNSVVYSKAFSGKWRKH